MKRIRISVNLIHYFQDHRQLAKIFIKNDMQTIEDLHNHIVKIFNIDKNFYLMCQNHFLPSVEEVDILNDNDLIYVIPNLNLEEKKSIIKKKKKKNLEISTDECVKKKSKKKKKQKPIENLETVESDEQNKKGGGEKYMETNFVEEAKVSKKKKKRQKKIENINEDCQENAEMVTNKSSQLANEELMETSNIVETDINEEAPKKKKRKHNEHTLDSQKNIELNNSKIVKSVECNLKNKSYDISREKNGSDNCNEENEIFNHESTSNYKINETIIFRESNIFDSIFTNQNEHTVLGIENNLDHNFVNETRRKRRRCISPPAVLPEEEIGLETILGNNIINENPKRSIVQIIEKVSPKEHNELLQNIKHSPRQTYSLTDVLHFKNQTSSSINGEKSLEGSVNRSALRPTRKQLSGVGKVLDFLKIEQESDDISENNESMFSVPKRKRIRTRKRKQKNSESPAESNGHSDNSIFIPPKTIAAPKFHIKFEDNVDTNANSVKGNPDGYFLKPSLDHFNSENSIVHSTPLIKTFESTRKLGNCRGPTRMSLNDINPDELPSLVEMPAIKNIILFKKLKLGSDYNPTVSNYILAEIMDITKNGDELHLKILDGHEELEDPIGGRFSCNTEDEEVDRNEEIQVVERNILINPKIVNNFEK